MFLHASDIETHFHRTHSQTHSSEQIKNIHDTVITETPQTKKPTINHANQGGEKQVYPKNCLHRE